MKENNVQKIDYYKRKLDYYEKKKKSIMNGGYNICSNCTRLSYTRDGRCCNICIRSSGPHTGDCDTRYSNMENEPGFNMTGYVTDVINKYRQ